MDSRITITEDSFDHATGRGYRHAVGVGGISVDELEAAAKPVGYIWTSQVTEDWDGCRRCDNATECRVVGQWEYSTWDYSMAWDV